MKTLYAPFGLPFDEPRFWTKVDFSGPVSERLGTQCWVWMAGRVNGKYGQYLHLEGTLAHRRVWIGARGPIPEKYTVDHLCRNTLCVRPDHLECVTNAENVSRSDSVSAVNARKTHCHQGHEFTEANTRIIVGRKCRECDRLRRLK